MHLTSMAWVQSDTIYGRAYLTACLAGRLLFGIPTKSLSEYSHPAKISTESYKVWETIAYTRSELEGCLKLSLEHMTLFQRFI